MSYTKNNWANGDTITAEKLNNTEDQVAKNERLDVPVTVIFDGDTPIATTDAVFSDVKAAYTAGRELRMVMAITGLGIIFAPLVGVDAVDPTALIFAVDQDFAGSEADAPEPVLIHIVFSAEGLGIKKIDLSVSQP